jgi:hypothetical protein
MGRTWPEETVRQGAARLLCLCSSGHHLGIDLEGRPLAVPLLVNRWERHRVGVKVHPIQVWITRWGSVR